VLAVGEVQNMADRTRAAYRSTSAFHPGFLAGTMALLVLALVLFSGHQIRTSRRIVLESMQRGAISLAETVGVGGENALRAYAEIEALAAERLLDNARMLRDLETCQPLENALLARIGKENALFRINVFDDSGRRVATNAPGQGSGRGARTDEFGALLTGEATEMIIGYRSARHRPGDRFAAAVARRRGGAIVVNVDAERMLAFQKAAGVGRLIQDFGESPGVVYVVLQDEEGILAASAGVTEISRIDGDSFLEAVSVAEGRVASRETTYEGRAIMETAMPFAVDETNIGLLRVGLSSDMLQAQDLRVRQQLAVLVGLLALFGVTGWGLVRVQRARSALESRLERQDRLIAMGELASGVAHEVRNPLNAIGMIVQRMEREFRPEEGRDEYLSLSATVRREVGRVNDIVQQFLSFARPPKLSLRPVQLVDLLEGALQVVRPLIEEKGLRLVTALRPVGMVQLDPAQVKQVMLNLLENAIAATATGEIEVSCAAADHRCVEIRVRDTGVGIQPENLERMFDLYFTTRLEGTGLGLSMVQRIVSEHGGRIEVDSRVGKGTTFRVVLPRGVPDGR